MNNSNTQKSAFIAIVGKPNVGKSSLLNKILGAKIAIVSSKPQTTRTKITGILTENDTQFIFVDTPGIHRPKNNLGKYMIRSVKESVNGVDCCIMVVEAGKKATETELNLIEKFKSINMPVILVINKIDTLKEKEHLMKQILSYSQLYDFKAVIPICAINGDGIDPLKEELKSLAMEGGFFFDENSITDQPEKVLVGEIIREKILRLCQEEIPHGVAIVIERMRMRENQDILDIDATIYCEKSTHKGILIGKNGSMLKKISTYARQDIEGFFDCKVFLQTWIKVKEDWRNNIQSMKNFGFDERDFNK